MKNRRLMKKALHVAKVHQVAGCRWTGKSAFILKVFEGKMLVHESISNACLLSLHAKEEVLCVVQSLLDLF